MRKPNLLKALAPTLVLFSTQAAALPFQSIDPRSLSMGGVGVASGTSANAGFMNPALLSAAHEDEDFSMELPILGARFQDPDELIEEVDNYQDNNLESDLTTAVDAFNASPSNATAAAVGNAADAVLTQLLKFTNKPIQGEVVAGVAVGIPSKTIGASLTASSWGVVGGQVDITTADQNLINGIIADATSGNINDLLTNPAIQGQAGGNDVVDSFTSGLEARGAVIREVGVSLAREVNVAGHDVAVGITPKAVKVKTFDYRIDVNTADFDTDTGIKEYSDFNIDFGLAKDYGNGWKSGLVLKNLISNDYQTTLGNTIKIEPQARLGVSHANEWLTVAADLDLIENEPAGFESKSQYLGVGVEADLFDWAQFRAGYRHNMSDSDDSIPTFGLGFSPFGAHVDFAIAGTDASNFAVAFQLGFRF